VIATTSARALISSESHPHLNRLNSPPSCDPGEADAKRLGESVLYFSSFILRYARWRKSEAATLTKIPAKNRVTRGAKSRPKLKAVAHQGAMQYGHETK